jgi:glycosyltransferase involved in cell wall biosynthesis
MRLLIVSHTPHYLRNGLLVGWGSTIREIDHLAEIFDEVVHVAPFHKGPPENAAAYCSSRVRVRSVPPAGGGRFLDKLAVLARVPSYARVIVDELRRSDVVHVRCPANISLIAIVLLIIMRKPRLRWVKYAGSWRSSRSEALSYKFQRWWLYHNFHRGLVTVNGEWSEQPVHIHSFLNPCLTDDELIEARVAGLTKELSSPMRLLYVGRIETAKGVGTILKIVARLRQKGLSVSLDLVGDGPERRAFEREAINLDIQSITRFRGWLERSELTPLYRRAHILLLPSESEGWPKVVSEAMAYGAVPVASAVGSIPQYLERFGTGTALSPSDLEGYASAISDYVENPDAWKRESVKAVEAASLFTYSNYVGSVRRMLGIVGAVGQTAHANSGDMKNSKWLETPDQLSDDLKQELRGLVVPTNK